MPAIKLYKKSIQNTSFPQEQDYSLYNHLGQDEYHAGEENKVWMSVSNRKSIQMYSLRRIKSRICISILVKMRIVLITLSDLRTRQNIR